MTSAVRRTSGDFLAAALAEVSGLLTGISDTPLWSATDSQVTDVLVAAAQVRNQLDALQLRVVAEAHGRDIAGRRAAGSTQAWLRDAVRITPAEAKQQMALATALSGDLERTRQALTEGVLSVPHARVVSDALGDMPAEVSESTRVEAEAFLVEQAQVFDPWRLAKLGRRVLEVVDPDAADTDEARRLAAQERRSHQRRHLSFTPDGRGTVWLKGRLDSESAAIVRRALDPLAAPRPTDPDQPDVRSPGARAADALVEVCRRALAGGGLPAQRAERPQVVVTVDIDKLRRGVGAGVLDTGADLSPGAVRRLACDADVIPAVLGSDSIPLDVGRTVRLFTRAQRRALILRDRGCAFPGCDRPPHWCDAHHIRHWVDGGATDVNNGVLLCGYHHRVIHKGQWRVRIHHGPPEFIPPGEKDPSRKTVRNHSRHRKRE